MKCGTIGALATLIVLCAAHGWSYDSKCYVGGGSQECHDGPQTAQEPWIGASDEHRQIWQRTVQLANLPMDDTAVPTAISNFTLRVFTDDGTAPAGTGPSLPTMAPVSFAAAKRVQLRTRGVGEFAELPDFGFALWDWATGLETCPLSPPLPGNTPVDVCHAFKTHMGAVNSNHFLPQAQAFFAYYHQLALGRAAVCKTMEDRIVGRGGTAQATRYHSFIKSCQQEAFVLEAIGHHFLQDAWSTGHMWERWGSPDLVDFTDLQQAQLVAMTSGLIHGARGVVQAELPFQGLDVNDPLCAPADSVTYVSPLDGLPAHGVGDLYLDEVLTDSGGSFSKQFLLMFSCTASAVRQVSRAMGVAPGPLDASLFEVTNPTGDDCFGQRVTNRAVSAGIGLDFTDALGGTHRIELDSLEATLLVPLASSVIGEDLNNVNPAVLERYAYDLSALVSVARLRAARTPDGLDLAQGGLGPLLGVDRNASFVQQPLAPYVDPPLPWPDPATVANDARGRAQAIARAFHAAHATEWCNRFAPGAADQLDLERLRAHVDQAQSLGGDELEAACDACETFASRHLRVGTDANDYDTSREPLCFYAADDLAAVQYAYQPGTAGDGIDTLAARFCGCADVSVSIQPPAVTLAPGATRQFTATVLGANNLDVTWTATGGAITSTGLYTAGSTAGVFSVTATSVEAPTQSASAGVTIANPGPAFVGTNSTLIVQVADPATGRGCNAFAPVCNVPTFSQTATIPADASGAFGSCPVERTQSAQAQGAYRWTFGADGTTVASIATTAATSAEVSSAASTPDGAINCKDGTGSAVVVFRFTFGVGNQSVGYHLTGRLVTAEMADAEADYVLSSPGQGAIVFDAAPRFPGGEKLVDVQGTLTPGEYTLQVHTRIAASRRSNEDAERMSSGSYDLTLSFD